MAQMHFYVDHETEAEIRRRAESAGMPVSRYLAELVRGAMGGGWPEGWFARTGGAWVGPPQKRETPKVAKLRLPFE